MSRLGYQPEVDGLRALAVVPVVLFHAGVPGFGGGFIGVDVFFVISGYLITGIIVADLNQDRFSLKTFYERRVRRIIPALFFVIACCLVAGMALFLPFQLRALGWSSINAVTFTSNIWFWMNSGYFASASDLEPLLHTWSLSVEEQFYLFFPIGLAILHRAKLPLLPAICGVLAASLLLSAYLVFRNPSATFYLIPTRAWELMVGAVLALYSGPSLASAKWRDLVAAVGLALILSPVFLYSSKTPFPGLAAIPPCLGTAMVIWSGIKGGGFITGLVGSRILVGIGLISYSLYLWHWPIFVFSRQFRAELELPMPVAFAGIAASVGLAWLTWRFVEAPFRNAQRIPRRPLILAGAAMTIGLTGIALVASTGLPARLDPTTRQLAEGRDDLPREVRHCILNRPSTATCPLGGDGPVSFAVWGDSHAAALGGAVGLAADRTGNSGLLFAFNGCGPARGAPSPTLPPVDQERCTERNRLVETALMNNAAINTVILAGFWQNYLEFGPDAVARLEDTIQRLRANGKNVIILAALPVPGYDVPWVSAVSRWLDRKPPPPRGQEAVDPRLLAIERRTGARVISLSPALCPQEICSVQIDGHPLFIDGNHVSNYANEALISPYLLQIGLFADHTVVRDETRVSGR